MDCYLDNNSTTRCSDRVREVMLRVQTSVWANPSSDHRPGRQARSLIEQARERLADFVHAKSPSEVVFTSGGTESIALAFRSALQSADGSCVVSSVEHTAVLEASRSYERLGCPVRLLPVDTRGALDPGGLATALKSQPRFLSLMLANNETGVLFDVPRIAALFREVGALVHVDAVQALGKVRVDVQELNCDYVSLSAHKFHGPKGIGAIWIRSGAPRLPMLPGLQESGLRGGTENTAGIVGMGEAVSELRGWEAAGAQIAIARDGLEARILILVPNAQVNGAGSARVPNTSNVCLPDRSGAVLVERLSARGVHLSTGAACSSGAGPSHVLLAMGLGSSRASSSLRISLSRDTPLQGLESVADTIAEIYETTPQTFAPA